MKRALTGLFVLLIPLTILAAGAAAKTVWKPKTTVVMEVRAPDGELRVYHTPAGAVYWSSDLPVVQGDKAIIHAFVSTGEATLKKAVIRLDNKELKVLSEAPWEVDLDTGDLKPGYHFVEVVSFADGLRDIGTATFMVVPAGDPVLQQTIAPKPEAEPAAPQPVVQQLVCRVRSRTDSVDQELVKGGKVTLKQPTLFWVQAAEGAKEFRYALIRAGAQTYRSPDLPLLSHILLQPKQPDGKGLEPGPLTLSVEAGNGKGGYGPPALVQIEVAAPEA
jgi:hypothetical protein